ncbi:unnamed protein product [Closterium sp. NIES-53]
MRCAAGRRVALLPVRRIAACTSPCPARAEPPCCPHNPATRHPAAARPAARSPAARAPPCWQPHRCPHRPARAALLLPTVLCAALLAAALPCPGCAPLFPSCAPPLSALRASLLLARRPAYGHSIQFDMWLDELQLYLLSNSRDSVSLFDHTSGASLAPPATADSAILSHWLTRDAATCLAALYDAVVARYSSPATAALDRLILPYLFPELSPFATIEDLVTHLRTSDARYRFALPAEFLDRNPLPMDHFLALDPTDLTVDLLEKHLLAAETSAVAAAAVDILGAEDVGATSAPSGKRRSTKGKGGKSGGAGSGGGGGGGSGGGGGGGGGGSGGSGGESGGFGGGGGGSGGGGGGVGGQGGAVQRGGSGSGERQQQQRRSETPTPQQLLDRAGQTCGKLHTQHRCFSCLDDAWRAEFGDEAERPHWAELLRSGVDIFALDYDAILAAMYALSVSAEGDYYLCVWPDPGKEAAAPGASESALPGTAPAEPLHTFTLVLDASRCFFCDSTTLTPLSAPVPIRMADPLGGPVLAHSSTVLLCPAVPSGSLSGLHLPSLSMNLVSTAALQDAMATTTTLGGQRVLICTCTLTGRHLATFTCRPGSSLYTLATGPPHIAASAQVSVSGPVAPPCSCRLLSHQTLLWHHRLGHPSLPRLRGMHSRLLVSGLPKSLPPLPPSPAAPCLPGVERRQRAAPHSSSFAPTCAPLHTLHMDVWGPARVSAQDRERYFLLVVDDYTRYTTVFPLRSKGEVPDVLIPWIRTDFSHGEGILQSFTLPASPQQNGIAEHCIGLVMEVARTSMIHAAAPHFPWPLRSGTLCISSTSGPGSCAFVRDTFVDKLSSCAIPCVFLGFPPDAPKWQFYHPTSCRVLPSLDVTFDKSVPFYRLFPYLSAPLPTPPLFLAPDPLPGTVPAEIYAGFMAVQELRWLTYLLTDLGEWPRSPPVLYVDNKAILALCHEQRLEHRTKHIALRYFLARSLQQRHQLRLSYMASRANTADVLTKALGSGYHQRFCTALGLVPTLPHLLVA